MSKKSKQFVPYHIASQIVRDNGITTRAAYWEWVEANDALYLPKMPNRVYSEWEGWNLFLGTTNSFEKTMKRRASEKKVWLDYWTAVRYAQAQAKHYGITKSYEWHEWWEEYEVMEGIPKRPEQVYEGFSWKVWLGLDIMSTATSAREVDKFIGIHPVVGQPANVLKVVVWKDGYAKMLSTLGERDDIGMPVKTYVMEDDSVMVVGRLCDGSGMKQYDGSYVIANVYQLFYELDHHLLIYKPVEGTYRQI